MKATQMLGNKRSARAGFWGVAKLVKAPDFDSGMRRFESFLPSQDRPRAAVDFS